MIRIVSVFPLLFIMIQTYSQLKFPKGFQLVDGENLSGQDDIYTNGKYSFQSHQFFRDYDFWGNNDSVKAYMTGILGFPFHLTKDSLYWGTGKIQGFYSYVVVSWDADVFELFSKYDDSGFSYYSGWLISTMRKYKKQGKLIMFPIHKN
ncbi:MAG: hypothetical protein ACHQEM_07060 [Chitinophagales bacterium]